MTILEILGSLFLIVGTLFSVLGVIGILRLPDTYSRLHATGKTGTLGIIGLCVGVGLLMPEAGLKVLLLAIFIIFSGPVASHAIAAAVSRSDDMIGSTNQEEDELAHREEERKSRAREEEARKSEEAIDHHDQEIAPNPGT